MTIDLNQVLAFYMYCMGYGMIAGCLMSAFLNFVVAKP